MLKQHKSKLKSDLKLENPFNLRDLDTNIIIKKLEHNLKLRETKLVDRIKLKK